MTYLLGKASSNHDQYLEKMLQQIRDSGLKLNPAKCVFGCNKILFRGHELSKGSILTDLNKITAIQNIQTLASVIQVKSFLGMTNFCNCFIPNY